LKNTTYVDVQLYTGTFQASSQVYEGWNIVSIPGLHPVNQNVNTWWQYKDPAANVFTYSNGYEAVTELTPGRGYFMKHIEARIYNTGDEWPVGGLITVPSNSISCSSGWSLIGGYNYSAAVSGITTVPPGVIEGNLFGYLNGYQPATHLIPGSGYWIKLSQAAQIHLLLHRLRVRLKLYSVSVMNGER
jgi:hypothetical protein